MDCHSCEYRDDPDRYKKHCKACVVEDLARDAIEKGGKQASMNNHGRVHVRFSPAIETKVFAPDNPATDRLRILADLTVLWETLYESNPSTTWTMLNKITDMHVALIGLGWNKRGLLRMILRKLSHPEDSWASIAREHGWSPQTLSLAIKEECERSELLRRMLGR